MLSMLMMAFKLPVPHQNRFVTGPYASRLIVAIWTDFPVR